MSELVMEARWKAPFPLRPEATTLSTSVVLENTTVEGITEEERQVTQASEEVVALISDFRRECARWSQAAVEVECTRDAWLMVEMVAGQQEVKVASVAPFIVEVMEAPRLWEVRLPPRPTATTALMRARGTTEAALAAVPVLEVEAGITVAADLMRREAGEGPLMQRSQLII